MVFKYQIFRKILDIMDDFRFVVSDADMNEYDGAMEISGSKDFRKISFRILIEECGVESDAG